MSGGMGTAASRYSIRTCFDPEIGEEAVLGSVREVLQKPLRRMVMVCG